MVWTIVWLRANINITQRSLLLGAFVFILMLIAHLLVVWYPRGDTMYCGWYCGTLGRTDWATAASNRVCRRSRGTASLQWSLFLFMFMFMFLFLSCYGSNSGLCIAMSLCSCFCFAPAGLGTLALFMHLFCFALLVLVFLLCLSPCSYSCLFRLVLFQEISNLIQTRRAKPTWGGKTNISS